ncbi:DUF2961 domain-containing protein [Nakamurella lactea]|uniref:DUF2961 domain-containing protein n=1 Tax=Nakamurella lactea TaxID=459515 RepID=UPI000421E761|nr:DUF2961 domain-containing protein [Nakamurella lactea]
MAHSYLNTSRLKTARRYPSRRKSPLVLVTAVVTAVALAVPATASAGTGAAPAAQQASAHQGSARQASLQQAAAEYAAQHPAGADARPDAKGPTGWDTYRQLDRVDEITTGVQTHQFSSFDRTGGNDDGFGGTYSCLRTIAEGCVLAERSGPGEIDSIWFTRDNGDITNTGNIRIDLDGKTVLDAKIQDIVDGKLGAPFVYPLVANADQSSGGVYIKVPMSYRSSMRVTTTKNPLFYHVTYRTFADAVGVSTYDPADKAADVVAAAKTWGSKDPKPAAAHPRTVTDGFTLKPGQRTTLANLKGSGSIDEVKLEIPQIVGPKPLPLISDDGRAHKGSSTFTVAIDPANAGVKLTRRFDANSNHQVADIYVDGKKVGQWPATDDGAGFWSYQTVTLPAAATAGKSSITVKNEFVSASIDWNEFRYWVDSVVAGQDKRTDELDVGTSTAAVASEQAHDYAIVGQTWTGTPNQTDRPTDTDDPKILASNELLRDVMVRVSFDGARTVESPLGEFFGSGLTESTVKAMFYKVDTAPDGWYTSWWPMPFAGKATVELVNNSDQTISTGRSSVTSHADPQIGSELRRSDARIGYFNASHHRADTVDGQDWLFLDTAGKGKFVGVSHTMRGHITSGNIRDYLEGDERSYADGSRSPALHGTGTEDFYESGWYFNRREFSNPMNGLSAMPTKSYGCEFQCDAPYRLMIGDAVAFNDGLTFGIEHGPVDNEPAEYSSTAYWYGFADQPAARITDQVDVGDTSSEQAHRYTGGTAPTTRTETFEGDHDAEPVTASVEESTEPVSFTLGIDPHNAGVTLQRMSLQSNDYQSAAVSVNGEPAGTWLQPLGNQTHQWLDDSFQLDPALTAGRDRLTITVTPTAGSPAWSAASYQAISLVDRKADHSKPGAIDGLVAIGTDSNSNRLSWQAATDDVAVHHYLVYGSTDRHFRPSTTTLVGSPTLSSFTHTGLGLGQTWYYQVRAVDSSGNTGKLSATVHATTGDTLGIEGESLLPAVSSTADVVAQGNCCGVTWSGNQQLWFQGTKTGDTVTLKFQLAQAGTFDLSAVLTKAPDYAIAQLAIDGKNLGEPIDGYQAAGVAAVGHDLGSATLAKGEHTLTLTATGKNAAATSYMIGLDVLELHLQGRSGATVTSYSHTATVVNAGDRQRVYDPSVGESGPWYFNDHTFVQGPDNSWHLFGITHAEPADPLNENFFGHASATSLTQAQYTKQDPVIQADPTLGEKHVWAPYVLQDNGTYYMYYSAGLDDNHDAYQIRLATSTDLTHWTKRVEPLFTDGYDARDPMVLRVGNQWVMYYTANSTPTGGNHQVAYRTSSDLIHWGAKNVAFTHPAVGTFGGPTESPFVVAKDGWYYLFICCDKSYTDTRVYKSRDPLNFDISQLAGHVDAHAAEVVKDTDGTYYVSGAGWGMGGVYLRPLNFNGTEVTAGKTVQTSNYRATVQTSPTTAITSMDVADGSGGWRSVLNDDYRATAPYLGVSNFGNTDTTGPAASVTVAGSRITLGGIPLGDEPVTADWTLDFGRASFGNTIVTHVTGPTTGPVWEASMTFDGTGSRIGDNADPDRSVGDVHGFGAWTQSTGSNASVAVGYRAGSAFGSDNTYYAGSGAVVWQPLWQPGGRGWAQGDHPLGSWRVAASPIGGDDLLGAALLGG